MGKVIIKYSKKKVSPYGGIVPILKTIKDCGVPKIIRMMLGKRAVQALYGYEDVFISWILTSLCGGMRLDHATKLKKKLSVIPGLKLPSHDTIGRVLKNLANEPQYKEGISGRGSQMHIHNNMYDEHAALNEMLISITRSVGALEPTRGYTLHIDATFIETDCSTSKYGAKMKKYGFYPMICLINEMPVYISMRNGDTNASFDLKNCLERCLDLLAKYNIKVTRVISDSAGYVRGMLNMLYERNIEFEVAIPHNSNFKSMRKQLNIADWSRTELETATEFRVCQVTSFEYTMTGLPHKYRIVAAREPATKNSRFYSKEDITRMEKVKEHLERLRKEKPEALKGHTKRYKPTEWKKNGGWKYKLIITSGNTHSPQEIITAYNSRGNAERQFAAMKNDFGWRLPPFTKMEENTVFMIAAALANNVFRGLVRRYNKVLKEIRLNTMLRDFKYIFIDVSCKHIGNNTYIFYDPGLDYAKLVT